MENYYEYLKLDMTASLDDIKNSIDEVSKQEDVDLQKIREIKSILLNDKAKSMYDDKLMDFILNGKRKTNSIDQKQIASLLKIDNTQLHDKFIWMAIVFFVISIISEFTMGYSVDLTIEILAPLLILVVFYLDWKLLAAHDKASFSKWWILLSPVYVYKREEAIGKGKRLFLVWMAIFIIYLLVRTVFTGGQAYLEKSACDVVTTIYHDQLNQYSMKCKKVTLTENNGRKHYGFAELNDGAIKSVTVTENSEGEIYVSLE